MEAAAHYPLAGSKRDQLAMLVEACWIDPDVVTLIQLTFSSTQYVQYNDSRFVRTREYSS
jgi:hypothetical protein